ncbi:MAG: electron transport complex subunit RsxB [Gammaproteobacteria bacterium]
MTSIVLAMILLGAIAAIAGLALGFAAVRWKVDGNPVADRVDALLPQTQCGQCGYPGCRPYAEAVAEGRADINLCPPGGEATVRAIARLLDRDEKPLAAPADASHLRAVIDENACVGCAMCLQACPVDAILGAPRRMHTVIADECTGCGLCVSPCPVDCIEMVAVENGDIPDFRAHRLRACSS